MRIAYPSDISDAAWQLIAPLFHTSSRGRPRDISPREILNAIFYVMRTGCEWRAIPRDLPNWSTVVSQRRRWQQTGVLAKLQGVLQQTSDPTVGIIDSTFIESAYGGGASAPSGYKRATGHSIHVLIDKRQQPLQVAILPANMHDAHGARVCIPQAKTCFPSLCLVLGDRAYRQRPLQSELHAVGVDLNGDSPPLPKGVIFKPLPLRWRVEQFFSWLLKWRRIAKNWCFTLCGFAADVAWCLCGLLLKRQTRLLQ